MDCSHISSQQDHQFLPHIVLRKMSFWFWFNPEIQTAGVSLLQNDNVLEAITLKRSGNTIRLHDDDDFVFK